MRRSHPSTPRLTRTCTALLTLLLAAVLAACGTPTAEEEPAADAAAEPTPGTGQEAGQETGQAAQAEGTTPAEGAAPGTGALAASCDGAAGVEEVVAQMEGLTGEERRSALLELAQAEAERGTLSFYTSTNLDESGPLVEAFTDATDLEVDLYRAGSEALLQRVLQEAQADYAGTDVIATNGTELQILSREGVLLPLETPVREEISEAARFDDWLGVYLNVFVAGWNTDAVSEPPTSWEQVLTGYPDTLAMELGDWDWFSTLVQEHFMGDLGMTEEEAVELVREAARNATPVDGHTTMVELMIAGEFDVVASAYQHRMEALVGEGAPIAWEPAVEPIIMRPNGIAIHCDADLPATSLLFTEFMLTDGQELLPGLDRTPANVNAGGGIPDQYELISVDLDNILEQQEKWEELYTEILREAGSPPVAG